MKLFVDDIRTSPSDKWHTCRTALSAIRALDQFEKEVDEVSLDHDISHQVVMGGMSRPYPCEETFEIVARYMAVLKDIPAYADWQPRIMIHTSNPVGAEYMRDVLVRAGFKDVSVEMRPAANRLETVLP